MLYTERIKALRSDDLRTQVARAIHVAQTTYSDYERAKCASRSSASSSWPNSTTSI